MTPDEIAARLVHALESRAAIEPQWDDLTEDGAYEVQDRVIDRLGGDRSAAKLGLTSRAKQQQMGVSEPLYGWFPGGSRLDLGGRLERAALIQPRVEPEIAFLTGAELGGPDTGIPEVLAATAGVMPALDVLDSRYAGYRFTLPDVVADNASAGRFVVGAPVAPAGVDLRLAGCLLEKNGELVSTAAGAAVLEHPAAAVAWFVRKLAERDRTLPEGSIVLAGSLTEAVPVEAGDVVTVSIDRLGSVTLVCQ